jgi:hypothetical protein
MVSGHPFGYIKGGKIYRNGFREYEDREIGEVREDEEASLKFFEQRFDSLNQKVLDLVKKIDEGDNKGSFYMKLIHLKDTLHQQDALGDFDALYGKLEQYEAMLQELINKNRSKNLEIKQSLLVEAREVIQGIDWKEETGNLLEIKQKWIRTGSVPKDRAEGLELEFQALLDDFFQRKQQFFEDRQRMYDSRLEAYQAVIDQIGEVNPNDIEAAHQLLRDLKMRWRHLDPVPKQKYEKLKVAFDQAFREKSQILRSKQKVLRESHEKAMEANLTSRNKILNELREAHKNYPTASFKRLKELLEEWKNAGPVSREERIKLNEEFFQLYDLISEKKFILKIARSKKPQFDQLDVKEQLKIKMNVLKELLRRDEQDLEVAKENASKFTIKSDGFSEMITGKLTKGERKVRIKRLILEELKKQVAL